MKRLCRNQTYSGNKTFDLTEAMKFVFKVQRVPVQKQELDMRKN